MTLKYQLAGLLAGLVTALAGTLLAGASPTETLRTPPRPGTVMFIDHATVLQCTR